MTELSEIGRKEAKKPLLSLEVNPPRGVDIEPIFKRMEKKISNIDFFNVTDSALARMKLAALPFASILKQRFGIEPLVNVACRDRNLIALQGDLLAGWCTGIRSVVALTGDAVSVGDSPETKAVFEVNSVGLLHAIATLNGGRDLAGNELKGSPNFCAGVVVNPGTRNIAVELARLKKKKEAGACYALSQPVFDELASHEFLSQAKEVDVPIFLGLIPFKNSRSVQAITKVPGIRISEEFKALAGENPDRDLSDISIEQCLRIARRTMPLVRGFHVVTGANSSLAFELLSALKGLIA